METLHVVFITLFFVSMLLCFGTYISRDKFGNDHLLSAHCKRHKCFKEIKVEVEKIPDSDRASINSPIHPYMIIDTSKFICDMPLNPILVKELIRLAQSDMKGFEEFVMNVIEFVKKSKK